MTYFKFFNLDFFIIFFSILFINLLILSFRNNLASLLNIFDQPNKRKIHKYPTPLVGGICLFITISIALVLNLFENYLSLTKFNIYVLFYLIFFATGLWDDAKSLSPKIKTFIITATIIILIPFESDFIVRELNFKYTNKQIILGNFSLLFTIFCIFALYNALNFIDGYNGSATSIIIFWTFILLIKNPNILYYLTIMIMILIFFYNISGKTFLGNSGTSLLSIFFSLSIINDYNIFKTIYADEILLILLFPGLDMIRVTFERILNKKKVYYPDKTHFHHYLIKNNIKYIWQSIIILTIMPFILLYIIKNIIVTIFISILIYFILLIYLKNNK